MTVLAVASGSKAIWYLTRGSGVVTLALLTISLVLGIAGPLRWRSALLPRFTVAALHRSMTLLAVAFLAVHIVTSVLDSFAPIGWKDAVIPFVSAYRPLWLGLGALAFDLIVALVLTSLLRHRLGYRTWRWTHWLAYACWPLAFVHSLGTGSDARAGWLQLLDVCCLGLIVLASAIRIARSNARGGRRAALGGVALGLVLLVGSWYRGGPGAQGWAARAGTPSTLLHTASTAIASSTITTLTLPKSFTARLSGNLTESQADSNGLVDVHVESRIAGSLRGRLRLVLQGIPLDGGGVSMTASGVAFAALGSTSVYQGEIIALDGNRIGARVSDGSGKTLDLSIVLDVEPGSRSVSGTLQGSSA